MHADSCYVTWCWKDKSNGKDQHVFIFQFIQQVFIEQLLYGTNSSWFGMKSL